jgi:hypothetical protein
MIRDVLNIPSGVNMQDIQQTSKMQQIREAVAAKRARSQLIESLGDTELDWMGFDRAEEIAEHVEWALNEGRGGSWIRRFGSKPALLEHISGFRRVL